MVYPTGPLVSGTIVFHRKFSTFWFFVETLIKFVFRRKSFVSRRNPFRFSSKLFWFSSKIFLTKSFDEKPIFYFSIFAQKLGFDEIFLWYKHVVYTLYSSMYYSYDTTVFCQKHCGNFSMN